MAVMNGGVFWHLPGQTSSLPRGEGKYTLIDWLFAAGDRQMFSVANICGQQSHSLPTFWLNFFVIQLCRKGLDFQG